MVQICAIVVVRVMVQICASCCQSDCPNMCVSCCQSDAPNICARVVARVIVHHGNATLKRHVESCGSSVMEMQL